jgi:hypothetical protein
MTSALPGAAYAANDDDRHRHGLVVIHGADDPNDADTPRPVQLRADRAAQHLGLQATDIERLQFDLSALARERSLMLMLGTSVCSIAVSTGMHLA